MDVGEKGFCEKIKENVLGGGGIRKVKSWSLCKVWKLVLLGMVGR
jgi:hypothetical protein